MPRPWRSALLRGSGLFVVLALALLAAIVYFPTFAENIEHFKKIALIPALKRVVGDIEEGGVWAYVAGQQFFKGCNTMGIAAAVLFACGAVAGESHRGTMEIWLGRPVHRTRLLLERWLSGALAVCVPVFASSLLVNPMLTLSDVEARFSTSLLLLSSTHQSLLLLAVYSLTFLYSTVGTQPTRIAFVMLFAAMIEFSMYLVETITNFSLFRLSDIDRFLAIEKTGALDLRIAVPLAAVSLVALAASIHLFSRRLPS